MGGRRTSMRFDEEKYVDDAMTFILEHAAQEGHKPVADSLRRMIGAEPVPDRPAKPAPRAPYKGGRG